MPSIPYTNTQLRDTGGNYPSYSPVRLPTMDELRGRTTRNSIYTPPATSTPSTSLTNSAPRRLTTVGPATYNTTSSSSSSSNSSSSSGSVPNNNNATAQAAGRTATDSALETAQRLDAYTSQRFYENLEAAFPNYREVFGQMSSNTEALLSGQVPTDVADMIRMYSAEQGVQGANANTARNLGMTSLDLATQGFQQGGELFNIANEQLTPDQYDVFGATDQIRSQLISAGMLTPAQAAEIELASQSQSQRQSEFAAELGLKRDQLRLGESQFNAEMSWQREVSNMNREWDQMIYDTQQRMYNQATAARRAENQSYTNALNSASSILTAR